jgi:hypothetical protein
MDEPASRSFILIPEPLPAREQHGFQRTTCGCEFCRAPCRHIPGSLDVADLARLCPSDADLFSWAEEHLRAITDKSYPTLVPARQASGECHWLIGGGCGVHANAPYGCAFFDTHMSAEEADRRAAATIAARREDESQQGPYYRVWRHLIDRGLTCPSGDRAGLGQEYRRLRRTLERHRRRRT